MKHRFLFVFLELLIFVSILSVAIVPRAMTADPSNPNFQFYIPNDKSTLTSFRTAIENVDISNPIRSQSIVYATGGVFGSNVVSFAYNPDQTGCAEGEGGLGGLSNCDGTSRFGGANDNLSVYSLEYYCDTQKNGADLAPEYDYYASSGDQNAHFDIKASVVVSLADYHNGGTGGLFDPTTGNLQPTVVMHWAGFTGIQFDPAQTDPSATLNPTDVTSENLPAACRPAYLNSHVYQNSTDTNGNDGYNVNENIKVISTVPAGAAPTSGVGSSGNTDPEGACEGSSNLFNFGWIACPMLAAVDDFVDVADSTIQGQLNFNTSKFLDADVHQSWNIMKDIATSLLIIIMLVMVISQAVAGKS